jgi:hypothetical protein
VDLFVVVRVKLVTKLLVSVEVVATTSPLATIPAVRKQNIATTVLAVVAEKTF